MKKSSANAKTPRKETLKKSIEPIRNCRVCATLPLGSIELTGLLLVLVFSLVSVLLTAVFALQLQRGEISRLQERFELSSSL